jgi:DNA-binding transcriptional LysR family regulator
VRRIGSFRVQVFGAPSYFKAHGHPQEPGDLAKHNCLSYSFSAWGSDWSFDREDGEETVHVSGNMESNSFETLKLAAVHGQGLIRTAGSSVTDEVKTGQLVPVLTEFVRSERAINAIYPNRLHLSAKVRAVLDLATKHFCRSGDLAADKTTNPASSDAYQLA